MATSYFYSRVKIEAGKMDLITYYMHSDLALSRYDRAHNGFTLSYSYRGFDSNYAQYEGTHYHRY